MSFAAWTSGWSNGLIPRIEPATAVANSQRKNSCPSSYGSASRTSCACRSGASGGDAGRGHEPLALLAGRLGEQLLDPEAEAARVGQAAPCRARAPALAEREPELEPGLPSSSRQASAISHARSSSRATSTPISAAGTIPNGDSAE